MSPNFDTLLWLVENLHVENVFFTSGCHARHSQPGQGEREVPDALPKG